MPRVGWAPCAVARTSAGSTVTRDVPGVGQAELELTYDEVFPSGTFTWNIYRRRGLKAAFRRTLVMTHEVLP